MGDHKISFTEYPTTGAIRNLIVDGTHWVSVGSAHTQASVAAKHAREALLLDLKEQVEGLDSPHRIEVEESGAVVSVPVDRLVFRTAVLDAINNRLKEF